MCAWQKPGGDAADDAKPNSWAAWRTKDMFLGDLIPRIFFKANPF